MGAVHLAVAKMLSIFYRIDHVSTHLSPSMASVPQELPRCIGQQGGFALVRWIIWESMATWLVHDGA